MSTAGDIFFEDLRNTYVLACLIRYIFGEHSDFDFLELPFSNFLDSSDTNAKDVQILGD